MLVIKKKKERRERGGKKKNKSKELLEFSVSVRYKATYLPGIRPFILHSFFPAEPDSSLVSDREMVNFVPTFSSLPRDFTLFSRREKIPVGKRSERANCEKGEGKRNGARILNIRSARVEIKGGKKIARAYSFRSTEQQWRRKKARAR